MSSTFQQNDLISLLKVFDVNYVKEEDYIHLHGLSVNNYADLSKAIELLLLPEFRTFIPEAKTKIINGLKSCLNNQRENFENLFDRVQLAFEDELIDNRYFMRAMLQSLEATHGEREEGP